jgi:predicted NBD/HSP70 family sugar kinase
VFIGVHVGRSQILVGLVSENGDLSFPSVFTVKPEADSESIALDVVYFAKTIGETVPVSLINEDMSAIGITVDGVVDAEHKQIIECADHGLENVHFEERIQRNFTIDVFVRGSLCAKSLASREIVDKTERNAEIIAAGMLCKYLAAEKNT